MSSNDRGGHDQNARHKGSEEDQYFEHREIHRNDWGCLWPKGCKLDSAGGGHYKGNMVPVFSFFSRNWARIYLLAFDNESVVFK